MSKRSFHHISLLVTSTERALGFYQGVLGLARIPRPELGFPGAWLSLGGGQLHLLELRQGESPLADHVGHDAHLALAVDDLEALTARLTEAGVTLSQSRSGRAACFCRDPDGNGIELIQQPD